MLKLCCLFLVLVLGAAFTVSPSSHKVAMRQSFSLKMSDNFASVSASDVLADLEELDSMVNDDDEEESSEPKQAALNRLAIKAAIEKFRRSERDGGSAEVQIAIATEKILYMTTHLKAHPHDYHSTRGLRRMVEWRKTQLNYLYNQDAEKCMEVVSALGIRFTPKSRFQTREAKYAAYKSTKNQKALAKIKARRELNEAGKARAAAKAAAATN